ncbi:hypothetical protein [Denitratisoma oestradiolicum]|uniref:Uncharacterized protein n=1 Tax=Denitratisoma oestradiolicum TaxID=311182 RepID=A0A6S6XZ72_9PROT|nr:hypothetical protein [Denitratisoma oestradiolicum]TWO78959.1 hypothetical protein CBW56_17220 [Denitratisoma oestradiolicum]CAB1368199.1 protein of unknown function [Denitratisoma oestradiolicum]
MNTLFRILFIPALLLLYYVAFVIVFGTDKLRVDRNCEVHGFFGNIEEVILGDRFWQTQIEQIDRTTARREEEYVAWRKANEKPIRARTSIIPPGYKTPAEEDVFALRAEADRIEREEDRLKTDSAQVEAIQLLKNCRSKIVETVQQ